METVNTAYASPVSIEGALEILREYPSRVGQAVLSVKLFLTAGYSLKKIIRTVQNDRLTPSALQALRKLSSKLHPDLIPLLSDKEESWHPKHGIRLERNVALPWTVAQAITRLPQEEQLVFVREHVAVQGRDSCINLIALLKERSPSKKKPRKVSQLCPRIPSISSQAASQAKPFTLEERAALDAVIREYEGEVRLIAYQLIRRLPANVEVTDLIQEGLIGLCEGYQDFDPSQGAFKNFFKYRVLGRMLDFLRRADHLSRSERRRVKRLQHAINGFEHIDRGALVKELGIQFDALEELLLLRSSKSFSGTTTEHLPGEPVDHDQETWFDHLAARSGDPVHHLQFQERVAQIEQATKKCFPDDNERGALILSVVLGEIRPQEAAKLLGVTPSRISQLTARLEQLILAN